MITHPPRSSQSVVDPAGRSAGEPVSDACAEPSTVAGMRGGPVAPTPDVPAWWRDRRASILREARAALSRKATDGTDGDDRDPGADG